MMKKAAIVVGHSNKAQGATNKKHDITEFMFNTELAKAIKQYADKGTEVVIVNRKTTYGNLPNEINELNPDYIISLHCNAFNTKASGTEVLYYSGSVNGRNMAVTLQNNMVEVLQLNDRGVKGITSKNRGGHLLKNTKAPCVIIEPFFIDNNTDYELAKEKFNDLAMAIVNSMLSF